MITRPGVIAMVSMLFGSTMPIDEAGAQSNKVQRVVSSSGIEAWLVEEQAIPIIAMQIGFSGGSSFDSAEDTGMAEILASMLTEGAGDLDATKFSQELEALATTISFSASRDQIYLKLRSLSDNFDKGLDLLRLALSDPHFDEEDLERIKQQTLVEIRDDETRPSPVASKAFFSALFPEDAYGRPVIGIEETIGNISSRKLRSALGKYIYDRSRMKIGVVGAISADELKVKLDYLFAQLPESESSSVPETVVSRPAETVFKKLEIPQSTIIFGHSGFLRSDPDFIPAYVLNYIIGGGGFSSRLTNIIREERGLAYSVHTQMVPLDRAGLIIGSTSTGNENVPEVIKLVRDEWKKLAQEGVTKSELEAAKRYLTGAFPLSLDSNSKIASFLVSMQMDDLGIDYLERRNMLVEAVTVEDIKHVAARLLKPDELFFVVAGNP